jgi:hypothetical protein
MGRFDWPVIFGLIGSAAVGISTVTLVSYWFTKVTDILQALPK